MRPSVLLPFLGLLMSACAGYHIGPVKPTPMKSVEKVAVINFKNDTLEPRVEVLMSNALIKQLHQDGTYRISSEQDADAIIKGTILRIERNPARSARNDYFQTSEYTLGVVAKVEAFDKRTGQILIQRTLTGNSSFFVSGSNIRTADVNKDERQAIPKATEDLATQMTSYLTEGW